LATQWHFQLSTGKGTNKRAKHKRKACISFCFRVEVPSVKVRINEQNTKEKLAFLFVFEWKHLLSKGNVCQKTGIEKTDL